MTAKSNGYFLGESAFADRDGTMLHADTGQALFHVEHSVGGTHDSELAD